MTLLIPMLLRLTMLFERGVPAGEVPADHQVLSEEEHAIIRESE